MSPATTEASILERMLSEAETEYAAQQEGLRVQWKYIEHLRAQLETLRDQMKDKPDATATPPANGRQPSVPESGDKKLWEHIRDIMQKEKRALRVPEIETRLKDVGIKTSAKGGIKPNIVSAIKRRPEIFRKESWGVYGLSEWAQEKTAGG